MDNEQLYINNIQNKFEAIMRLKHCVYANACFIVISFLFSCCFLAVTRQKGNNVETSVVSLYVSKP